MANKQTHAARRLGISALACTAAFGLTVCGALFAHLDISFAEDAAADVVEEEVAGEPYAEYAQYSPRVFTNEFGAQVQKTPSANGGSLQWGFGYPYDFTYYNNYVLRSDQRGCNSCHDLVDVMKGSSLMAQPRGHQIYLAGYPTETMTYEDSCLACHMAYSIDHGLDLNVADAIHAHMQRDSFRAMGGDCFSCHYVDDEGTFLPWDDVKYDVMVGITELDAETADPLVSYDQDTITPIDNMFTIERAKHGWSNAYVEHDETVFQEYAVAFTGEIQNPCELTIQQMIEMFGTETRVQSRPCCINGTGSPLIFQAEITGIPFRSIVDYLQPLSDDLALDPIGIDGYDVTTSVAAAYENDALLVFEINGQELPDEQGYPLALWIGDGVAAGMGTQYLCEMYFSTEGLSEPGITNAWHGELYGPYSYTYGPYEGELIDTPNIGVLSAETGQIFSAGEPVHLEGYAYAFNEQVTQIEFSFDRGSTWIAVPIKDMDPYRWVYWRMDLPAMSEPGSYLVQMRATSIQEDGTEHANAREPQFLINVQ